MTSEKNAEKNYAVFWKCALQVNSWTYNAEYQGGSHGLTEEAYNKELGQRLVNNQIKVVGIADHGSVENLDGIRATLQELGIIVLP